jgi:hypothetical protein
MKKIASALAVLSLTTIVEAVQPFALMRGLNATIRQELYPISDLCDYKLYAFAAGNYAPKLIAPHVNGKIEDSRAWNGTYGLTYKFCSFWSLGLAGSYNTNSFKQQFNQGKFHTEFRTWALSAFSGMEFCHGYINGIFNAGWLRFDHINRHFEIDSRKLTARGHADGMQYDALLEGGWYFWDYCNFRLGPIATIEYQWVDIEGYRERGASTNNLQYKHQHARSFVTGIGVESVIFFPCVPDCCQETCYAQDCPPGFSIKVFLAANEDWVNKTIKIKFRQRNLDGAPFESWPIYKDRTFFGSGGINLSNTFLNGVIFSLGYRGYWGMHHMVEHNISASLICPL